MALNHREVPLTRRGAQPLVPNPYVFILHRCTCLEPCICVVGHDKTTTQWVNGMV